MSRFTLKSARAVASAALLGAVFTVVQMQDGMAQADGQGPPSVERPHMDKQMKRMSEHSAIRIKDLHDKLQITKEQEELWGKVAQAMRDNETALRASVSDRKSHLKTMTAVDDLKSFQLIADQHSNGLKQLIPAFEDLYAAMSPAQQKNADHVFGEHQRRHAHM